MSIFLCYTFYNSTDVHKTLAGAIQGTLHRTPVHSSSPIKSSANNSPKDVLQELYSTSSEEISTDSNSPPLALQIQSNDGWSQTAEPTRAALDSGQRTGQQSPSYTHESHFPNTASSVTLPTGTIDSKMTITPASRPTDDGVKLTYIITQSFGGQLTRAVKNMMMQQCWAQGLPNTATILEPFSSKSLLIHSPEIWDSVRRGQMNNAARFSDYFDLKLYNHISVEGRAVPLVMWEEFLLRAPRQVVVVPTPRGSCSNHHLHTVMDTNFRAFLKGLQKWNFNIVKVFPINCSDENRGKKLIEVLSPFLLNSTIAFSSWRNYDVVKSWLDLDSRCNEHKYPADRLLPSAKMKMHMQNYRTNILRAKTTIAIMLRVERFLTLKLRSSTSETVDSCLNKTLSQFLQLKQEPVWANSEPFLTLDIGRYGSGIMQKNDAVAKFGESLESVTKSVTALLVKVYNGRWGSIEEWEKSFPKATEGIAERGYVATLQRSIAIESDCLILMGGGSFQEVAAKQYLQAHPDPQQQCLHVICSATAITTSLEKTKVPSKHLN